MPRPVVALAAALALFGVAGASDRPARVVSDLGELRATLQSARPGDVIVMRNGTWPDAEIDLAAAGSASAPITLRAETPGRVLLTGASRLTFSAPHVAVEGLHFKDGALTGGAVVRFASHHGRLSDSAVVDYNPRDGTLGYWWVVFEGDDNAVLRCLFKGKNNRRPVVSNRAGARRNQVLGSHFQDIAWKDENGRETIQIMGYGMSEEMGDDGAFFTLEANLFERAHGEGMEIVSIKSNRNLVRFNTFKQTKGGITNRSGNFNAIEGNLILGEKEAGSYGIRVTGQHHQVVNNYVADVEGAGLLLVAGEYIERALTDAWQPLKREGTPLGRVPRYAQVKHGTFAHNTFVNCRGGGIEIGSSYRAGWPQAQRILLPESNKILNNLVWQPDLTTTVRVTERDARPPLDALRFDPNIYADNVVSGAPPLGPGGPGIKTLALPVSHPAASRAGAGSPVLERDDSAAARRPLGPDQVGPAWLRAR